MAQPASPPNDDAGKSLHDLAVDAVSDLHQLAVGLAHAGAHPEAVQGLNQMAEKIGQVVKVLAQSPEVEQAAKTGVEAGPPAGPGGPPAPSGAAPGAPGGPPSSGPFGPATQALHSAMNGSGR